MIDQPKGNLIRKRKELGLSGLEGNSGSKGNGVRKVSWLVVIERAGEKEFQIVGVETLKLRMG